MGSDCGQPHMAEFWSQDTHCILRFVFHQDCYGHTPMALASDCGHDKLLEARAGKGEHEETSLF